MTCNEHLYASSASGLLDINVLVNLEILNYGDISQSNLTVSGKGLEQEWPFGFLGPLNAVHIRPGVKPVLEESWLWKICLRWEKY